MLGLGPTGNVEEVLYAYAARIIEPTSAQEQCVGLLQHGFIPHPSGAYARLQSNDQVLYVLMDMYTWQYWPSVAIRGCATVDNQGGPTNRTHFRDLYAISSVNAFTRNAFKDEIVHLSAFFIFLNLGQRIDQATVAFATRLDQEFSQEIMRSGSCHGAVSQVMHVWTRGESTLGRPLESRSLDTLSRPEYLSDVTGSSPDYEYSFRHLYATTDSDSE